MPEHGRFRFNTADTPAEYAETINHGGVRVSAEYSVRKCIQHAINLTLHHHTCKVFKIDLMHDACVGWYDFKIIKRFLTPTQKTVTLAVAGELDRAIFVQCASSSEHVHLYRMVNDQFGWNQRVDIGSRAAEFYYRVTHGRQIHNARNAGEVLQYHAGRHEGDFSIRFLLGVPLGNRFDGFLGNRHAVFAAQQVFDKNLDRVG